MTALAAQPRRSRPWVFRDLPVVPAVAAQLMAVLVRDDWRAAEIVELISADPALVVEVLNAANAGRPESKPYDSVERAAFALGSNRLHAIALSCVMKQLLGTSRRSAALLQDCWRHSRAVAGVAQRLACAFEVPPSRAYTAGLLHNVGLLALIGTYGAEYADLLAVAPSDAPGALEAERKLFDVDHCQAGAWLCSKWNLPPALEEVVGHHHEERSADHSLLTLVSIAVQIVELGGVRLALAQPAELEAASPDSIAGLLAQAASIPEEEARAAVADCLQEIASGASL